MERPEERRILLTTCISAFIGPFTGSIMSFAVPRIGLTFHASLYSIIWVPMGFLIAVTSFVILFGRISDIYGRVKLFRVGLLVYMIGSVLASVSFSLFVLIAGSVIIGFGGALLAANSTAIISHTYPPERRGGALGMYAMSVYIGLTSAPVIGGILVQFYDWQSVFWINIPFVLVTLVLSYVYMKGIDEKGSRTGRLDITGSVLFTIALLSIVIYLTLSQLNGFVRYLYLGAAGLVVLLVFIYIEKRTEDPMLDLTMFSGNRTFTAANITAFLNYLSTFSIVFLFSLYLESVMGYSPLKTGLLITAEPVFMVIFSPISGRLSDRYGTRGLSSMGMFLIGISFIALYFLNLQSSLLNIVIPLSVIGIGFGFFSATNTNAVMGSVSRDKFGVAAGTLGTMRFTGQLASLALSTTILAVSVPRGAILGLFAGANINLAISDRAAFISGFRTVMLVAGILCFIGTYTSLMRSRDA